MENAANEFGIRFLLHFTQARNLPSILEHGILPVNELKTKNLLYDSNDDYRYDGCTNASCLSIQVPNYKMFYKYRNSDPDVDWVVLALKKEILWEKDCAFCVENAASNSVTQIPVESRKGVVAFRKLYDEFPNKPTRLNLQLDNAIPTNPQAEVLVFDKIEPSYILAACFKDDFSRDKWREYLSNSVPKLTIEWLYRPRHDYEYWK